MDTKALQKIIDIFENSSLTELEYDEKDTHIQMKKGQPHTVPVHLSTAFPLQGYSELPHGGTASVPSPGAAGTSSIHTGEQAGNNRYGNGTLKTENEGTADISQSRETADASSAAAAAGNEIITAPLVGTFYRTPSPDSPPYVEKGSKIKEGDTLCIIEAMKLMNKLEAEFDCEVIRIYPQQGDMVEFGAALFEVKRI